MCGSCGAADDAGVARSAGRPRSAEGTPGPSRRRLLAGLGAGLSVALTGAPGLTASASAATLKDGRWCNPARGYFPAGGHYGAPRGQYSHAGQDVTNTIGTAVYAAAAGTVVRRGWGVLEGRTGYGLVISHGGGQYTYYGHFHTYHVGSGASVSAGQRIGDMGATGNVTGPHLHFETHTGGLYDTVDPVDFMAARGVDLGGGWSRIDPGAGGKTVVAIQHLMTQRGYELVPDGDYGPVSVSAVKQFQAAQGLIDDGQVGPQTWPHLVYSLSEGDGGSHVRALQVMLNKHSAGLLVDGDFGSVTDSAVRSYQSANRLYVDGLAGQKTWKALVG